MPSQLPQAKGERKKLIPPPSFDAGGNGGWLPFANAEFGSESMGSIGGDDEGDIDRETTGEKAVCAKSPCPNGREKADCDEVDDRMLSWNGLDTGDDEDGCCPWAGAGDDEVDDADDEGAQKASWRALRALLSSAMSIILRVVSSRSIWCSFLFSSLSFWYSRYRSDVSRADASLRSSASLCAFVSCSSLASSRSRSSSAAAARRLEDSRCAARVAS